MLDTNIWKYQIVGTINQLSGYVLSLCIFLNLIFAVEMNNNNNN